MPLQVYTYPNKTQWEKLLQRPALETSSLEASVANILKEVKQNGDNAVRRFSSMFDKVSVDELAVTQEEINNAQLEDSQDHRHSCRA